MQMTIVVAAVFAVVCLSVAITGFVSLKDIADPAQAADARGFAWFWMFLALVSIAFGVLGWWLARTSKPDEDA